MQYPWFFVLPEGTNMRSRLTVRGQVTIPKAMRDHLGLVPGAPVHFAYAADGGVVIMPVRDVTAPSSKRASRFDKLKGINRKGWAGHGLKSTEEIMAWLRGYDEDRRDPGFAAPRRSTVKRK